MHMQALMLFAAFVVGAVVGIGTFKFFESKKIALAKNELEQLMKDIQTASTITPVWVNERLSKIKL